MRRRFLRAERADRRSASGVPARPLAPSEPRGAARPWGTDRGMPLLEMAVVATVALSVLCLAVRVLADGWMASLMRPWQFECAAKPALAGGGTGTHA
jgi:hypothetical protein